MTSHHDEPGTTMEAALIGASLVRWPAERWRRQALAERGRPCLLVVDAGAPIPATGPNEDWIRSSAGEADVAARLDHLRRATVGASPTPSPIPWSVALDDPIDPAAERLLHRLSARPERLTSTPSLLDAAWPGAPAGDLDGLLASLVRPLGRLGWQIVPIDGVGHLLERRRSDR